MVVLQENYTRRGAFLQYMVKSMRIGYKEKKVLDKVYVFEPSFKKVSGYEVRDIIMLQNLKVLNYDYITRRKQDEKFTQSNCPCEHRSYYGFWLIDSSLLVCGPMGETPSVLITPKEPKTGIFSDACIF